MKILKTLSIALLLTASLFAFSPAKAGTDNGVGNGGVNQGKSDPNKGGGSDGGGSSLPINNQIWFLIIAGAAIGTTVIVSRIKSAKSQNNAV